MERFSKHLPEVHAIMRELLASVPWWDEPLVNSRHLSPAYIETSPYFQEWMKPTGTVDVMTLVLIGEPVRLSLFGVGRNERQGLITEREIDLGKLLLPHLRRAVTISNVLDIRTIEGSGWSKPSMRSAVPSY
jgi:hypothetical protein